MIPFYSVGSWDYECLSSKEGNVSAVYYVDYEDRVVRRTHNSFEEWIKAIPEWV